MKTYQRKAVTGHVIITQSDMLKGIKTEGAFQDKIDKGNEMLKTAPHAQKGKALDCKGEADIHQ